MPALKTASVLQSLMVLKLAKQPQKTFLVETTIAARHCAVKATMNSCISALGIFCSVWIHSEGGI